MHEYSKNPFLMEFGSNLEKRSNNIFNKNYVLDDLGSADQAFGALDPNTEFK